MSASDVRGQAGRPLAEVRLLTSAATGKAWRLGLLLAAATILAYQPAWNAGFIWDDDIYVTGNPLLTAPDGLWRIWFSLDSPSQYFPLTYTTFWIERSLWGLDPAGYHWVNLLLHTANALLLWRLLKRLDVPGAWLAAAIFALHPVHVESVAWITERKNVLSLFFMLLALRAWIELLDKSTVPSPQSSVFSPQSAIGNRQSAIYYGLSLGFYALALLAKTTACTLPAALVLVWWWKGRPGKVGGNIQHSTFNIQLPTTKAVSFQLATALDVERSKLKVECLRRLIPIVPFLILGAAMGLLTMWWERHHQLTQGKLFEFGLLDRILIASRAVWFYAGKLFWPADLAFSYPRWTIDASDPRAYGGLAALAGLGVAILYARRFLGRGIETGVLFFVATLSPMLGFIMLYTFAYTFVADHYQYVASIGLIALAAGGISRGLTIQNSKFRIQNSTLFCLALLLTLGILTWRQCATYTSSETLWRATLARNPGSLLALVNLGSELSDRGDVEEAAVHFQKALAVQPGDAVAAYSLGNIFLQQGRLGEALPLFQQAAAGAPADPVAQYNLGVGLLQQGRLDEAVGQFRKAVALQPDYAAARFNLGIALFQQGQAEEAAGHFQKILEAEPGLVDAHFNLAVALSALGRIEAAAAHYREVVQRQPQHAAALNNLAWVLATCPQTSVRDGARAVELAERVARLDGANPMVLDTLAAAYAEAGRFADAVATGQKAIRLAARSDPALADSLQARIRLYQARTPFRDVSQSNAPARPKGAGSP